jgi:hypothetical protein
MTIIATRRRIIIAHKHAAEDFRWTVFTKIVWCLTRSSSNAVRSLIVSIISLCLSTSAFIATPISFWRLTIACSASIASSLSIEKTTVEIVKWKKKILFRKFERSPATSSFVKPWVSSVSTAAAKRGSVRSRGLIEIFYLNS